MSLRWYLGLERSQVCVFFGPSFLETAWFSRKHRNINQCQGHNRIQCPIVCQAWVDVFHKTYRYRSVVHIREEVDPGLLFQNRSGLKLRMDSLYTDSEKVNKTCSFPSVRKDFEGWFRLGRRHTRQYLASPIVCIPQQLLGVCHGVRNLGSLERTECMNSMPCWIRRPVNSWYLLPVLHAPGWGSNPVSWMGWNWGMCGYRFQYWAVEFFENRVLCIQSIHPDPGPHGGKKHVAWVSG